MHEAEAVRQISLSHVLSQLANFGLGFRRDAPAPVEVAQGGQDLVRAAASPAQSARVGQQRRVALPFFDFLSAGYACLSVWRAANQFLLQPLRKFRYACVFKPVPLVSLS